MGPKKAADSIEQRKADLLREIEELIELEEREKPQKEKEKEKGTKPLAKKRKVETLTSSGEDDDEEEGGEEGVAIISEDDEDDDLTFKTKRATRAGPIKVKATTGSTTKKLKNSTNDHPRNNTGKSVKNKGGKKGAVVVAKLIDGLGTPRHRERKISMLEDIMNVLYHVDEAVLGEIWALLTGPFRGVWVQSMRETKRVEGQTKEEWMAAVDGATRDKQLELLADLEDNLLQGLRKLY